MMLGLLGLFIGLLGQWLLGFFIAASLLSLRCPDKQASRLVEPAGLGFVLGIGITAWLLFVWSFCGGLLGILPSALLAVVGWFSGGTLLFYRLRFRWNERDSRRVMSTSERQDRAASRICQWTILVLCITAVLQALLTPQKLWDERAIFALKARVLFEDRSIRSPTLLHPDFVQYHPRYPLLVPLAEQHVYALLGMVDDRLSKVLFPLLYCGLVLTTAGVLNRYATDGRAWLSALLMATVPVIMPYEYGFLCGQADAPIACYHGISVLYLWDGLMRQRRLESSIGPFVIAGLCAGLGAFTKDEGIAYLMIDIAALGLFSIGSIRRLDQVRGLIISIGLYCVAAGLIIAPWFVHRCSLATTTEMNYFERMTIQLFLGRLDTLRWTIPHLLRRMFWEFRDWGLQWWLMIVALIAYPCKAMRQSSLVFLMDVIGALAAIVVAGMLAPAQLDEHIGGSSHRFLMQITPVAVLFAVTLFLVPDDESPPRAKTRVETI